MLVLPGKQFTEGTIFPALVRFLLFLFPHVLCHFPQLPVILNLPFSRGLQHQLLFRHPKEALQTSENIDSECECT